MHDPELYSHLLGIEDPWLVVNVELDLLEEAVRIYIGFDGPKAAFCCPECGQ